MSIAASTSQAGIEEPVIEQGMCHALMAFDIGAGIDLELASKRLSAYAAAQRKVIKHTRRAPAYFELRPSPVRITLPIEPVVLAGHGGDDWTLEPVLECLMFDFGAVSVSYRAPVSGRLGNLLRLSEMVYDNPALMADAQRHVRNLLVALGDSVGQPSVADTIETYVIFEINALRGEGDPSEGGVCDSLLAHPELLARILRSEMGRLSPQEVADALASRVSYGPGDAAVIDWNAAVVIDRAEEAEDVRTVLEYANVELLEMRFLDDRLDSILDDVYRRMSETETGGWRKLGPLRRRGERELRRIARLQMDSALLFEGVNNALKLIGDQYLARVYRLAAQRFHLSEHDASIARKLSVLENIYDKLRDHRATLRMEILEWIIIILIAFSIVISFK